MTYRQTDTQKDHMDRQTDSERQTDGHTGKQTDTDRRQTNRWLADRQTRQRSTNYRTARLIDRSAQKIL